MNATLKIQERGNCQCCGRLQAVLATGRMSKHGYRVQDAGSYGYFVGVCRGAQFQPMQIDRTETDRLVSVAREDALSLDALAVNLKAGTQTPLTARSGKRVPHATKSNMRVNEMVPYAQAPAYYQAEALEGAIYAAESKARAARSWANDMEKLVNEKHGQPCQMVTVE